jgi:hypothetical protein
VNRPALKSKKATKLHAKRSLTKKLPYKCRATAEQQIEHEAAESSRSGRIAARRADQGIDRRRHSGVQRICVRQTSEIDEAIISFEDSRSRTGREGGWRKIEASERAGWFASPSESQGRGLSTVLTSELRAHLIATKKGIGDHGTIQ